jgi:anaerobic ribonucleoside-triphosphate reductase activating protein
MLNLAHASVSVDANGPGRRFTLWLRGCSRRCPGCFNPELMEAEPRTEVSCERLLGEALAARPIDGLTLSGGEPFDQAVGLSRFLDGVRATPGLDRCTVLAFTGYSLEEIRDGASDARRALLRRVDLLVDGPYREERSGPFLLRGSSNQRLIPLTPAGRLLLGQARPCDPGRFEVVVGAGGEVLFTGLPPHALVDAVRGKLGQGAGHPAAGERFCPLTPEA